VAFTTWWGSATPRRPAAEALALERATCDAWRAWVASPEEPEARFGGQWQALVDRSALVLKLLASANTGAIAAAATTSLPAHPGGVRNQDYRLAWVRDAAFTAQALTIVGHAPAALAFLECMEETTMRERLGARTTDRPTRARREFLRVHGRRVPARALSVRCCPHVARELLHVRRA
jgi:GH15 family glucan-1,4-alpha-glucosidase